MATEKKTARQKKLGRIMATIERFAVNETYADETAARDHLANAIDELKEASDKLIESES